jgi:hypothetical protein
MDLPLLHASQTYQRIPTGCTLLSYANAALTLVKFLKPTGSQLLHPDESCQLIPELDS